MFLPPALPVALLILAGAPAQAPLLDEAQPVAPGQGLPQNQAQALAVQLGHVVGTAMECAVDRNLDGAEAQAEQMVNTAAMNAGEDPIQLDDRFHDAMAEAREQVLDNQGNCAQAKTDLQKLQGRTPD